MHPRYKCAYKKTIAAAYKLSVYALRVNLALQVKKRGPKDDLVKKLGDYNERRVLMPNQVEAIVAMLGEPELTDLIIIA